MPRRFVPLLLLLPGLLLFWNLGYAPFWNPDEGRYASASYEMAYPVQGEASDWIVPHLNTLTRLNKPPLVYWLAGAAFRIFGPSEVAGRLPSALAALGVALVLFYWGRAAFGKREGLAGAAVWCTSAFPFAMGRVLNTDMLLTFSICLATYGIWLAFQARASAGDGNAKYGPAVGIAGLGMGLALLAKGPVGVALPLVSTCIFLAITRNWKRAPWGAVPVALIIALVIGGPWYLAAQSRVPDFVQLFFVKENISRLTGSGNFHNGTSVFYYVPVIIGGLLPWTGYLFTTFSGWVRNDSEKWNRIFLWVYAGFIVAFFSISKTKLISYVLPAFPALALLLGCGVARWDTQAAWRRYASVASMIVIFAIAGVAGRGFLLSGKVFPHAEGMLLFKLMALVLLAGIVGQAFLWWKGTAFRVLAVQGCIAAGMFGVLLDLGGRMAPHEDSGGAYKLVESQVQPDDAVVCYGAFHPNMVFYARRPIYFFGFKNTSGYREEDLHASPYFPDYQDPVPTHDGSSTKAPPPVFSKLVEVLHRHPRAFIMAASSISPQSLQRQGLILWGSNNDAYFYATWPKPAGLDLDLAAPRSRLKRNAAK